jgi:hypothetical protein
MNVSWYPSRGSADSFRRSFHKIVKTKYILWNRSTLLCSYKWCPFGNKCFLSNWALPQRQILLYVVPKLHAKGKAEAVNNIQVWFHFIQNFRTQSKQSEVSAEAKIKSHSNMATLERIVDLSVSLRTRFLNDLNLEQIVLSCVYSSVTNNNKFRIGWLDY